LLNKGHSITLLSPTFSEQDQTNAKQLESALNIKVIKAKAATKALRMSRAILFNISFSEAEFYLNELVSQLDAVAPTADAILFTASSLSPYLSKADFLPHCIKLIDFMDVDSDKWSQYAQSESWPISIIYKREHKLVTKLEKQAVDAFDAAFVISSNEQTMFNTKVKNTAKLHVLGNGIEHTTFAPSDTKSDIEINFLFTGVMDYKPNIDAVLWFIEHCWQDIKANIPNATFTIAGMNPVKSIMQLTNDPQIKVTGFVDNIMPYYNQAHIFVAPFTIARGVQNKVLQAMSCAIPVVTSTLGAEGIKCTNNEDIVIADTTTDFTTQCITLAKDADLRERIAKAARQTILKHYAWDSVLAPLSLALSNTQSVPSSLTSADKVSSA
jgi:sugar transferase (PEP-CTERM/EpsH1 system associated)